MIIGELERETVLQAIEFGLGKRWVMFDVAQ
jgi:hypothetical protein